MLHQCTNLQKQIIQREKKTVFTQLMHLFALLMFILNSLHKLLLLFFLSLRIHPLVVSRHTATGGSFHIHKLNQGFLRRFTRMHRPSCAIKYSLTFSGAPARLRAPSPTIATWNRRAGTRRYLDVLVKHRKMRRVVSRLKLSAMWRLPTGQQNPDKLDYWIGCNRL